MHVFRRLAEQLPISQHFLIRYAEEVQAEPDLELGELVRTLYAEVYRELLEHDQLIEVCTRIEAHGQKIEERAAVKTQDKRKPTIKGGRQFSDYFNEFIEKLDTSQVCLWLADFDTERARFLYFREDYEVVAAMVELKLGLEREHNRVVFEGALFGFGGKYGGSGVGGRDEGEVRVHDMSQMSSGDAFATLAALGRRG